MDNGKNPFQPNEPNTRIAGDIPSLDASSTAPLQATDPSTTPATMPGEEAPLPTAAEEPRRARPLLTLVVILAVAAILIGLAHRYASQQAPSSAAIVGGEGMGQPAPDFTVKDVRGNTFRLSELKGKVVIIDFWATWCQPCKIEIPWFIDLYDRYKAQGLEVVGVAMDEEGMEVVKPFAERYKMNYHVVIGNDGIASQFGGIYGLPTTFIVDRDGKIQSKHMGLVSRDTLEEAVKKLL